MRERDFIKMCINDFLQTNSWECENKDLKKWGNFTTNEIIIIFKKIYKEARETTLKHLINYNSYLLDNSLKLENEKERLNLKRIEKEGLK